MRVKSRRSIILEIIDQIEALGIELTPGNQKWFNIVKERVLNKKPVGQNYVEIITSIYQSTFNAKQDLSMESYDCYLFAEAEIDYKNKNAGYAFIFLNSQNQVVYSDNKKNEYSSLVRLQYLSFIEALTWFVENVPNYEKYRILAQVDCEVLVNTYNQWLSIWVQNGWVKVQTGEPLKNLDLVLKLNELKLKLPLLRVKKGKYHLTHNWKEWTKTLAERVNKSKDSLVNKR